MSVPNTINDRPDDRQIRITSPTQFVAAIPALLGFHPEESLIAVLMDGKQLVCSMRSDLDDDPSPIAGLIVNAATNGGADRVLLLSRRRGPSCQGRIGRSRRCGRPTTGFG